MCEVYQKRNAILVPEEGGDPSIHIVISGDFAQLLLCFEIFIFSPPVKVKTNAGPSSEDETKLNSSGHRKYFEEKNAGVNNITRFQTWQSFKTVLKLTENMRHMHDPCMEIF